MGFNVDGTHTAKLTIGAVGQQSWEVEIKGKAAHAGVAPEKGISATLVASVALAEAYRGGWFGKVDKPEACGSSNAGVFGGKEGKAAGDATNVVTDYVHILGEARSADAAFAATIVEAYRDAFAKAQAAVADAEGATAEVKFEARTAHLPFQLEQDTPAVTHAMKSRSMSTSPNLPLAAGWRWPWQRLRVNTVARRRGRDYSYSVPFPAPFFSLTTCLSWSGYRAEAQVWPGFAGEP